MLKQNWTPTQSGNTKHSAWWQNIENIEPNSLRVCCCRWRWRRPTKNWPKNSSKHRVAPASSWPLERVPPILFASLQLPTRPNRRRYNLRLESFSWAGKQTAAIRWDHSICFIRRSCLNFQFGPLQVLASLFVWPPPPPSDLHFNPLPNAPCCCWDAFDPPQARAPS